MLRSAYLEANRRPDAFVDHSSILREGDQLEEDEEEDVVDPEDSLAGYGYFSLEDQGAGKRERRRRVGASLYEAPFLSGLSTHSRLVFSFRSQPRHARVIPLSLLALCSCPSSAPLVLALSLACNSCLHHHERTVLYLEACKEQEMLALTRRGASRTGRATVRWCRRAASGRVVADRGEHRARCRLG